MCSKLSFGAFGSQCIHELRQWHSSIQFILVKSSQHCLNVQLKFGSSSCSLISQIRGLIWIAIEVPHNLATRQESSLEPVQTVKDLPQTDGNGFLNLLPQALHHVLGINGIPQSLLQQQPSLTWDSTSIVALLSTFEVVSQHGVYRQEHICELPEAKSRVLIRIEPRDQQSSIIHRRRDSKPLQSKQNLLGGQPRQGCVREEHKCLLERKVRLLCQGYLSLFNSTLNSQDLLETVLVEPV